METTTNYQWQLPTGSDELSPEPFNENFRSLDNQLHENENKIIQYAEYANIDQLTLPGIYYISDYPFSDRAVFGALCIVLNTTVNSSYTEKCQFLLNCDETIKTRYMEDNTWTGWKKLIVKSDSIQDGAVTTEKTSFCAHATTPVKIGTWIDGTPIWRWSFLHGFTLSEKETLYNYRYLSLNYNDIVKDINDIFVISGNVRLYAARKPCAIDDVNCTNISGTSWHVPDTIDAEALQTIYAGYFGYIDFVSAESNLQTNEVI